MKRLSYHIVRHNKRCIGTFQHTSHRFRRHYQTAVDVVASAGRPRGLNRAFALTPQRRSLSSTVVAQIEKQNGMSNNIDYNNRKLESNAFVGKKSKRKRTRSTRHRTTSVVEKKNPDKLSDVRAVTRENNLDQRLTQHQQKQKNVARFVPHWLRNEITWRQRTIQLLHLPDDVDTNVNTNHKMSSTVFYEDSIPSFYNRIRNDGGVPPISMLRVLDKLVDAGLGNKRIALNYRDRLKNRWKCNELEQRIKKEKDRLENQSRKHRTKNFELNDLLSRLKDLSGGNGSPEIIRLNDDIARAREQEQRYQATLNKTKTTITRLSQEQQKAAADRSLVPKGSFEKIDEAVAIVMPDIAEAFAEHIRNRHSIMLEEYQALDAKTDLTRPHEWFLHARLDKRKIIFHGGPTNSGKTYAALERLKKAKTGMYYGPLRLLAAEVYEKLNAAGVYCNLKTGQEKRKMPFATHTSATIEVANLTKEFDVVVIDEIQMVSDQERGFAWTRALIGSRCKEIHVCGGLEAEQIVRKIAKACGDDFEVQKYKRFSDLQLSMRSLAPVANKVGFYKRVRAGDCVVAFSRNDIFAIKREIEKGTSFKCCVIYGALPPHTRSEQARRFNDPESGYDILVASDAIGMGLNLNIGRIIFNSIYKYDGTSYIRLDHSSVKQIAGRAGRRNSPFPNGTVTVRDPRDLDHVRSCLSKDIEPIKKAGLLYTGSHVETFSEALNKFDSSTQSKELHHILTRFNDMASVKSDYFVSKRSEIMVIAKVLAGLDLSLADKYTLCMCPVSVTSPGSMNVLRRFSAKMAVDEVAGLTKHSVPQSAKTFDHLSRLCSLFNEIELFLWLNFKFPAFANAMEEITAQNRKEVAMKYIAEGLSMTGKLKLTHCYIKRDKSIRKKHQQSLSKRNTGITDFNSEDWL